MYEICVCYFSLCSLVRAVLAERAKNESDRIGSDRIGSEQPNVLARLYVAMMEMANIPVLEY